MAEKIDYGEVMSRIKGNVDYVAEEAYNKGYEQAKLIWSSNTNEESYQRGLSEGNDIGYKDGVKDGRNEAWETARKIVTWPDRSLINSDTFDLDPGESIFTKYSASEVIAKLKAYEDDKIKRGDIVNVKGSCKDDLLGVVTKV